MVPSSAASCGPSSVSYRTVRIIPLLVYLIIGVARVCGPVQQVVFASNACRHPSILSAPHRRPRKRAYSACEARTGHCDGGGRQVRCCRVKDDCWVPRCLMQPEMLLECHALTFL